MRVGSVFCEKVSYGLLAARITLWVFIYWWPLPTKVTSSKSICPMTPGKDIIFNCLGYHVVRILCVIKVVRIVKIFMIFKFFIISKIGRIGRNSRISVINRIGRIGRIGRIILVDQGEEVDVVFEGRCCRSWPS